MKCDFAVATGVTGERDKREVRSTVCVALMDRTSLAGTCDVGLIRTERARVCVRDARDDDDTTPRDTARDFSELNRTLHDTAPNK